MKQGMDKDLVHNRVKATFGYDDNPDIAAKLDIAVSTVCTFRRDDLITIPSLETMYKIAKEYSTPLVWLLGLVDEKPKYEFVDRKWDMNLFSKRFACVRYNRAEGNNRVMAKDCHLQTQTIDKYVNGFIVFPNIHAVYSVCDTYHTSPDWLMGLIDHVTDRKEKRK